MQNNMKKILLYLAAAATMFACAKEIAAPEQATTDTGTDTDSVELISGNIEFSGTLEAPLSSAPRTRTELGDRTDNGDGTYTTKVLWVAEDEISILWGTGAGDKTTARAASDGETTSFSATVGAASDFYALYPSSLSPSYNGEGGLLFTIPGTQDGSFEKANIAVAKNDDRAFAFKNVCGLLKFTVAEDITAIKIHGANDEAVAGDVRVTFDGSGIPVAATVSALDEITIATPAAGTYYVCTLPLASLAGFDITVTTAGGDEVIHSENILSMARGKIIDLNDLDDQRVQTDYFITEEGAGKHNGRSWENAMTWQEAASKVLAANRPAVTGAGSTASSLTDDTTISDEYRTLHATTHFAQVNGAKFHFAQGNYSTDNYVRIDFPESAGAAVIEFYGGYNPASTGKDLSDRNAKSYPTVITQNSSHRHFYFRENVDITFDGFTFADGIGDITYGGGHAMVRGVRETTTTSITYNDCIFRNNIAAKSGTPQGGGVINANGFLSLNFTGCSFTENSSLTAGGVLYIDGSKVYVTFEGNDSDSTRFTGNSAGTEGGVIYMDAECNTGSFKGRLTIGDKVSLTSNRAVTNGGTIAFHSGELEVGKALFKDNSATNTAGAANGGAIYLVPRTSTVAGVPNIRANFNGTSFIGNSISSTSSSRGGAIGVASQLGNYYFRDCLFQGNDAKTNTCYGGAIGNGNNSKGMYYFNGCRFYDNLTTGGLHGFDMWFKGVFVGINNCSFYKTALVKQSICIANPDAGNAFGAIITNSSIIGQSTSVASGAERDNNALYMMNNVFFAEGSTCGSGAGPVIFGGYNYGGAKTRSGDNYWTYTNTSYYNSEWAANTSKNKDDYAGARANYSLDEDALFIKAGENPLEAGCDAAKMKTFMEAAKFTETGYDNEDFGPKFYAWLVSIGAWGKDIQGNARGDNWWPGCYEKN